MATNNSRELHAIAKRKNLSFQKDLEKIKQISAEENIASVIKLISDIQQEIARQISKHHQVVTHYMTQHGYIPLWVLVNVLTFGKITAFYHNMKPNDKEVIARTFGIPEWELYKYMSMLGLARNRCAHDERFFDMQFRQSIHTKSIKNFSNLNLNKDSSGSYLSGIKDAYAIAIIFALILSKSDIRDFISSMKTAFSRLEKALHTINIVDVMKKMGFPTEWQNISKLR